MILIGPHFCDLFPNYQFLAWTSQKAKEQKKSKQAKNSEQFWAIIIQGTQYLTQKHYMTTHILSPFKKRRGRPRIPPTRRFGLLQVEFQVWLCRVHYPFQHTWVFQSILKAIIKVSRPNFWPTSRNSMKCKVEKWKSAQCMYTQQLCAKNGPPWDGVTFLYILRSV